jgi:hypothetical protein
VHFRRGGHADAQLVLHEWQVDHSLIGAQGIAAEGGLGVGLDLVELGLCRDDVDRAARRVTAAQRALGTAVHLDAFDIVKHRAEAAGARHVDAIHVQGDGGIPKLCIVIGADAPDVDGGAALLRADLQTGHHHRQVSHVGHAEAGQLRLGEGGGGARVVLQVLPPAIDRDDDLGCPRGVHRVHVFRDDFLAFGRNVVDAERTRYGGGICWRDRSGRFGRGGLGGWRGRSLTNGRSRSGLDRSRRRLGHWCRCRCGVTGWLGCGCWGLCFCCRRQEQPSDAVEHGQTHAERAASAPTEPPASGRG